MEMLICILMFVCGYVAKTTETNINHIPIKWIERQLKSIDIVLNELEQHNREAYIVGYFEKKGITDLIDKWLKEKQYESDSQEN